ncbi:MAG: nucleotide pyrophosphohydrolase [Alteromonadales bacterium]|nr:nucleotide pyrophosphohydrolase [Alteromonadales bacterium]
MENLSQLIEIVSKKVARDQKGTWSQGSITYYQAMFAELVEVKEEMLSNRQCYLEDELGDILWVYMCMLKHLEVEGAISMDNILTRAVDKYTERVNGINNGLSWEDIKETQKKVLALEQQAILEKSDNNKT